MLHWRFLLPKQPGAIVIHQKVFFKAWLQQPIYLYAPMLLCQSLYWYGFNAWKLSIKISCKRDFTVKKHHDLTRWQCLRNLLFFTLGFNIAPRDVFYFKLYKNKKEVFNHLYAFEGPVLHELNNRVFDKVRAAKHLLGDKRAFAQALQHINIPHIATEVFSDQQHQSIINLQSQQQFFIKPNTANCSTNAAALIYDNNTYTLQMIQGENMYSPTAIKKQLQHWAESQGFIIQPLLLNHVELQTQFDSKDLITFRLITIKSPHSASMPVFLKIEIALPEKAEYHRQFYNVYAIDLETYTLSSVNPNAPEQPAQQLSPLMIKYIHQAIDHCTTAHDQLFDCYGIGFDFCITPDGPVIIEGNYGWDVSSMQFVSQTYNLHGIMRIAI